MAFALTYIFSKKASNKQRETSFRQNIKGVGVGSLYVPQVFNVYCCSTI